MVVGGEVVVVVGGEVVVVGAVDPELTDEEGVVGGGVVLVVEVLVVEVLVVEVAGVSAGSVGDPLAPGCSLATTTPMAMVAPAATRAAARVRRRRRASARRLVSWRFDRDIGLIDRILESASVHANRHGYFQPDIFLWGFCEVALPQAEPRVGAPGPIAGRWWSLECGHRAPFHPMEGGLRQHDE